MLDEFDRIVGLSYLRAVHLNDSKGQSSFIHCFSFENLDYWYVDAVGYCCFFSICIIKPHNTVGTSVDCRSKLA